MRGIEMGWWFNSVRSISRSNNVQRPGKWLVQEVLLGYPLHNVRIEFGSEMIIELRLQRVWTIVRHLIDENLKPGLNISSESGGCET